MKKTIETPPKYDKQYELLIDKLNLLMWRTGLRTVDIAPLIGISQNSLARMLANSQAMHLVNAAHLSLILNIPWQSLSPSIGRDSFINKYGDRKPNVRIEIPHDTYNLITRKLSACVYDSKLTQLEIANTLDIRQASVSRLLSGDQGISITLLYQLLDVCGATWNDIDPF